MLIKNGLIHDGINSDAYIGDIRIVDGKIAEIGKNLDDDEGVIDASNLNVYPGLVEAHCHIGLDGYGIGFERADCNEYGSPDTPELRAIDGINPLDPTFEKAREAGITTVCTGPGSANVLGGTFTALKTVGERVDNMIIKESVAMKCAFGENPKRCYKEKGTYSRMSIAANLRNMLFKAKEYMEKKETDKKPAFDMQLEALIPVLKREIPLKAHAHAADDIFTAIRIAKEFNLKLTLEHVTEGHLVAEELVKENYPMAVGPTLTHATKFELKDKSWDTPRVLSELGGQVSIITDSPVIPEQHLPLCASLAIKAGMDPFKALQAITINPAKHIGIEDRVGSLEVGKDGDVLICDKDLFNIDHEVKYVLINGKVVSK